MVPLGVTIALCIRKLRKNTSGLAAILTTWRKTTSVTSSIGASIKKAVVNHAKNYLSSQKPLYEYGMINQSIS